MTENGGEESDNEDQAPAFGKAPTEEELEREEEVSGGEPDISLDLTEEGDWMHEKSDSDESEKDTCDD